MKRLMTLAALGLLVALALHCGGAGIIARGGDFILTVDDLRFEISRLGPQASYRDTDESRVGVVERLAARHFLAAEAELRGYADELLDAQVAQKRKEAEAEVYHRWRVESGIQTPRVQRLPWVEKLDRRLLLEDLHFFVYEVAVEGLEELKAGRSFESLAEEAQGRPDIVGSNMGWRVWKELDLAVANVVFGMDVGETSPIVVGADGYHLFHLADAAPLGLSQEIKSLRSKKFVAAMKEEKAVDRERAELIRRYGVRFEDEGIAAALQAFAASFSGQRPGDELMGVVVAVHAGGRVVVGDLFSSYYSVPQDSRPYVGDRRGIESMATDLMMTDLEAMAAADMGMDRCRLVLWTEKSAREDYLVPMMEDYFRSQIVVTEEDQAEYYRERHEDLKNPAQFKVTRILAPTRAEAQEALRQLSAGQDMVGVAEALREEHSLPEVTGELDWINVGAIASFDSVVKELRPGEISGIFQSGSGFEILRLDDWKDAVYLTYEEAKPLIRTYITNTRANDLLTSWVAEKKKEVGYYLDEDLLRKSDFPPPDYMARRVEYEERQAEAEEPVLPKIDR